MVKKAIAKGIGRHMAGHIGGVFVGFAIARGFTPDQIFNILEWLDFAGGLLLLITANSASALEKIAKADAKPATKKRSKLND